MNGKPPKFTSPWKTTPSPQFDAKPIYRKEFAPPTPMRPQCEINATSKPPQSLYKARTKPHQSRSGTFVPGLAASGADNRKRRRPRRFAQGQFMKRKETGAGTALSPVDLPSN